MTQQVTEWIFLGMFATIIFLIVAVLSMEYHMDRAQDERDEAVKHLSDLTDCLQQAHIEYGVCCCGDNMEGHDPGYNCGHSPLDMWDYYGEPVLRNAVKYVESINSED